MNHGESRSLSSFTRQGLDCLCRGIDCHGAIHLRDLRLLEHEHDCDLSFKLALTVQCYDPRVQVAPQIRINTTG